MNLSLLHITISAVTSTFPVDEPITVDVTIRNTANHPITILSWNSALDPKAGILGVFEMENTATGEQVPLVTAKFRRKLPPSLDEYIEIKSQHESTSSTTIPTLSIGLLPGTEYALIAKGTYRAVWPSAKADIPKEQLDTTTGGQSGEFKSNKITVKTSSAESSA